MCTGPVRRHEVDTTRSRNRSAFNDLHHEVGVDDLDRDQSEMRSVGVPSALREAGDHAECLESNQSSPSRQTKKKTINIRFLFQSLRCLFFLTTPTTSAHSKQFDTATDIQQRQWSLMSATLNESCAVPYGLRSLSFVYRGMLCALRLLSCGGIGGRHSLFSSTRLDSLTSTPLSLSLIHI